MSVSLTPILHCLSFTEQPVGGGQADRGGVPNHHQQGGRATGAVRNVGGRASECPAMGLGAGGAKNALLVVMFLLRSEGEGGGGVEPLAVPKQGGGGADTFQNNVSGAVVPVDLAQKWELFENRENIFSLKVKLKSILLDEAAETKKIFGVTEFSGQFKWTTGDFSLVMCVLLTFLNSNVFNLICVPNDGVHPYSAR